jgi:hypothetical protein
VSLTGKTFNEGQEDPLDMKDERNGHLETHQTGESVEKDQKIGLF